MEDQLSAHIRHLLLDYVHTHITTDYVQLTENAVAQLIPSETIPTYNPASLTLPSDPFTMLSQIHKLETPPPPLDKFTTTQDALLLLRKATAPPKGQIRSERLSWNMEPWDARTEDTIYRIESILTRRAVRETPVQGKTGGIHRALRMHEVERTSFTRLMASHPIVFKPVSVDPVKEPEVKMNQILDVVYRLNAEGHSAMRALLQSVSATRRLQPMPLTKGYRNMFLPARLAHDSPRPLRPHPDSPPLTPIFPRSARSKRANSQGANSLRSFAELLKNVGTVNVSGLEEDVNDHEASADDLARANMVVVDGWQTYAPSSPSTISSIDEEFDELVDMFPSSPNTSVAGAINLVQDIENSKLVEVQIPKERRIGGSLGLPTTSIIDKARKAGGLGSFLTPVLRPSIHASNEASMDDLHPLLTHKLANFAQKDPSNDKNNDLDAEGRPSPTSETEVDSMLGQASAVSSIESHALAQEEDTICGLFKYLSRLEDAGTKPPCTLLDPKALIRDERLFDEEITKNAGMLEQGRNKKEEVRLQLMPVPILPDPNVTVARTVTGYLELLVCGIENGAKPLGDQQTGQKSSPSRFLTITKGLAPLRVALSWVPYTQMAPIPTHGGILQNDLVNGEEKEVVDALLAKACGFSDSCALIKEEARAGGCGFDDQHRWRRCGQMDDDNRVGSETSCAEVTCPEIILTKRERDALLVRERGDAGGQLTGKERENLDEDAHVAAIDASIKDGQSSKKRSHNSEANDSCDASDIHFGPVKRSRLSLEDSGIGFIPGDCDQYFFDSDFSQGGVLRETAMHNPILMDAMHNPILMDAMHNPILMDNSEANTNDEHETQSATGALEYEDTDIVDTHGGYRRLSSRKLPPDLRSWIREDPSQSCRPDDVARGYDSCHPAPTKNHALLKNLASTGTEDSDETLAPSFQEKLLDLHGSCVDNGIYNQEHRGVPLERLDLALASHSLGIDAFAKLRAKTITEAASREADTNEMAHPDMNEKTERVLPRTIPQELYDNKTVRLPPHIPLPQTVHKYMASIELLQKQALVQSLAGEECRVELVERESLDGIHLIIDPQTAVIFAPLLSLPAHGQKLLEMLSAQSWRFTRILIVFEAYPESKSFRDRQRQKQGCSGPELELYAYTPPIVKAIKRFRRDMAIAEGCGKKKPACEVWCAFAGSVKEAASCARAFGDEAELADWTDGALWGEREWLDFDDSEDEYNLASLGGMNCFSALIILSQMTLQQFVDMSGEDRLSMIGPFIGTDAVALFNADIGHRMAALVSTED